MFYGVIVTELCNLIVYYRHICFKKAQILAGQKL